LISRFGLAGGIGLTNFKAFGATVPPATNPPANTVAPAVTPTSNIFANTLLTCTTGTWTNTPLSYSYSWYADGNLVQSGSGNTYTPTGQAGKVIYCEVGATNADGTGSANSNSVSVAAIPLNSVLPVITAADPLRTGMTITCSTGTWSGSPSGYTYQWYADGVLIGSATANSYVTIAAHIGKYYTCAVNASNGSGSGTAVTTLPTTRLLFSVTDEPSLIHHWKSTVASSITATGAAVSQWNDIKGTSHVLQATGANQPTLVAEATLGNKNIVRFDGVSDFLRNVTALIYTGDAYTVIALGAARSGGFSAGRLISMTDGATADGAASSQNSAIWYRNGVAQSYRCSVGGTAHASSQPMVYGEFNIFEHLKDAAGFDMAINDIEPLKNMAKVVTVNFQSVAFGGGISGVSSMNGALYSDSDLGEVAVFNKYLTQAERNKIVGAMAWDWHSSLVTKLDAGHPYKSAPP